MKKSQVDKLGCFLDEVNNFAGKIYLLEVHCRIEQVKKHLKKTKLVCVNIDNSLLDFVNKKFKDYILVAPDNGFSTHIKRLAKLNGKKFIIFNKKRVTPTKVKLDYDKKFVKENKSNNFVIVDDMVSTGGTLLGVTKCLKREGVKNIISVVVHDVSKKKLKGLKLHSTNSLVDRGNIDIIDNIKSTISSKI